MINNKGFGRFEVLTIIVLLMGVCAYFMYTIIQGSSKEDFQTMKNDAVKFSNAVVVNYETFHNSNFVYLGEVIDEKLMKEVKNPVGKGSCSISDSFVKVVDRKSYTTLKCGDYLIDNANVSSSTDNVQIYQVTDWSDEQKTPDDEEALLYNCLENGVEKYPEYYGENYLIYLINKEYGTDYYSTASITECSPVSKTFYRTKTLYDENKKTS